VSLLLGIAVFAIAFASLVDAPKRKSPAVYRRERAFYRAERAAIRYAALPAVVRKTRRARSQSPAPVALPDFAQDVEAALLNLEYSKKEAKQAVRRASGDDFSARLKNALAVLRSLARLTE
jgi:hypothetical protein